jgi:asparagine synthase (glutamine-hydrolysing)
VCGIAGIVRSSGERVEVDELRAMRDSLAHRGPDAAGELVDENVGLGHRRLSVIDVSSAANQPLFNEDGSVAVIFNGEIFNYRELCRELADAGHVFGSHSDTETLVHGWEEWGEGLVERLRGQFAFALWDRRQGIVFLARDRFGLKPLFYSANQYGLLFASEIKGLLAHPAVSRELDPAGLGEAMVWGHTAGDRTAYVEIRRLLPGHTMTLNLDGPRDLRIRRYWSFEPRPEPNLDPELWLDELEATIGEAVRLRMIADVPLGAFLSGGVDSSLVVALMVKCATGPVRSFAIGFEENDYDESHHAAAVAKVLGTDHLSEQVRPDAVAVLPRLVAAYDEPYGDASAIPTYYLSQMTRRHVTVALSGDGGDELFFGYTRYAQSEALVQWGGRIGPLGRGLAGMTARLLPRGTYIGRALDRLSHRDAELYLNALGFSPVYLKLLTPAVQEALGPAVAQRLASDFDRYGELPFVERCRFADLGHYLTDDVLTKVDRASMAHSLEVRCPLLDQEVAAVAARMPSGPQMEGGVLKALLRRLAYRHVPKQLLDRPKQGFSVPLEHWFRHDLRRQMQATLADASSPIWEYYELNEAKRRFAHHLAGRLDASAALWRILFAHAWAESNLR